MKILSVNAAAVGPLFVREFDEVRRIVTGIHKRPLSGPVEVARLGLAGDEQADLTLHGGLDKAVYAYPSEHYGFWAGHRLAALKRDEPLPPGSLGENLTLEGLLEQDVWIGDRLHAGSAILEVTQPRQPCFKLNAKMGLSHASKLMLQSGFTGFYLRVVQPGALAAGDAIRMVAGPRRTSLLQVIEQRRRGRQRDLF